MPSPSLFSDSSPILWACWTLGPCYRVKHDRNRTDKITYTARLILVTDGEVLFKSNGKDLPTVPETLLYLPPGCLYDPDFITDELTSRNLSFSTSIRTARTGSASPRRLPISYRRREPWMPR